MIPAEPVATTLVCFLHCTRGCGCGQHPAFPAPSCFLREEIMQNSGATRRESVEACVRHSWAMRSIELRCAIAHRRISRFRVRSFGPSRNDGRSGSLKTESEPARPAPNAGIRRTSLAMRLPTSPSRLLLWCACRPLRNAPPPTGRPRPHRGSRKQAPLPCGWLISRTLPRSFRPPAARRAPDVYRSFQTPDWYIRQFRRL